MSVLDDIVAGVRIDLEERRGRVPLADVERAALKPTRRWIPCLGSVPPSSR